MQYIVFYLSETKTPLLAVFFDKKMVRTQWLFSDSVSDLPDHHDLCDQFFDKVRDWCNGATMPLMRNVEISPSDERFWNHIAIHLLPKAIGSTGVQPITKIFGV